MSIKTESKSKKNSSQMEDQWGWFTALGIGLLIAGGIASVNLFASSLASVLYIAVMMLIAGGMQILHSFTAPDWKRGIVYLLTGLLYALAGVLAFYDPVFSAIGITMGVGILLVGSGLLRAISGFVARGKKGWAWVTASGCLTAIIGAYLLLQPLVGIWFLGALLTIDLVFQGWGFVSFGLALRSRRRIGENVVSHG